MRKKNHNAVILLFRGNKKTFLEALWVQRLVGSAFQKERDGDSE